MIAEADGEAMLVAGGTDLIPKLKRRQMEPSVLVGISHIEELRSLRSTQGGGMEVGAAITLAEVVGNQALSAQYPGYTRAASLVSSPPLRNLGTIGGNLLVDTRCSYYDMTYEWRQAAGFCLKKDGDTCRVAPSRPHCWAVSSSDTAPVAIALDATVILAGPVGRREIPVESLYQDDGMHYTTKQPDEVVASLQIPPRVGWRSSYVKLRRRGSIDFPIGGVAVALAMEGDRVIDSRIVLSGVGSQPVVAAEAASYLVGNSLDPELIAEVADRAAKPVKPLDNADLAYTWRKKMVKQLVIQAVLEATRVSPA
ncbi:MAG: FAD binding domain-containing protein [Acidimicrobiales bacterium]